MVKVTVITAEGEPDEVQSTIRGILGRALEAVDVVKVGGTTSEQIAGKGPSSATGWTSEDVIQLWPEMRSDIARNILAEIATQPTGYPWDELVSKFQLKDTKELAGKLSAFGHARRRLGSKPDFLRRNWQKRHYIMPTNVAEAIRQLANKT